MSALSDYQIQLGASGVIIGAGTAYVVGVLDGLGRDVRSDDYNRAAFDGAVMSPDWANPKTVTIELVIRGTSPADALAKYDALAANWSQARGPEQAQLVSQFRFKLPGRATQVLLNGRPRRIATDLSTLAMSWLKVIATFYAPDPRIYSDAVYTTSLTYGAGNSSLANVGNMPAPVTWTVNGAVTNPAVTRNNTSDRFDLTTVLAGGQSVAVVTDARTVTRSGGSNFYSTFSGKFLEIPAGGAQFQALGTSGGTNTVVATYRDTWL